MAEVDKVDSDMSIQSSYGTSVVECHECHGACVQGERQSEDYCFQQNEQVEAIFILLFHA